MNARDAMFAKRLEVLAAHPEIVTAQDGVVTVPERERLRPRTPVLPPPLAAGGLDGPPEGQDTDRPTSDAQGANAGGA